MSRLPTTAPRIWVVNDSADFLDLMRDVLSDAGYAVTTFEGRATRVEEIAASAPDLLVIDLLLGGDDPTGWEIAMLARAHDRLRACRSSSARPTPASCGSARMR